MFEEPITPSKYHHPEYEQLGYDPAYCAGGVPSFDAQGRPYMVVSYPFARAEPPQTTVPGHFGDLMFFRGDGWHFADLESVVRRALGDDGDGGALVGYSKQPEFIAATDEMFLLAQYRKGDGRYALVLITSRDRGESFAVHPIEANYETPYDRIATEHLAGHNTLRWPLLIAMSRRGDEPDERVVDYPGTLYYHILSQADGQVRSVKSGILSQAASRNPIGSMYVTTQILSTPQHSHIAWHETEVGVERGGNETYLATYDPAARRWSEKTLVGPSADDHGFPAVAMDSEGYIHVPCGAHASQVYYTRSTQPDDASAFEPLEAVPGAARATHLSFLCDLQDRLHLFFRDNIGMGPDGTRGGLSYVTRNGEWSQPRRVANSPQEGYLRMCNHLSMDRRGRLFLNYGYFTLDYRSEGEVDQWYYPVLAHSQDRGEGWRLVPDDFGLAP
ncbi:MAG: BNR-4 repeat-containing protein [Armatimonadota bacterium]